ncbi:hypothetical protein V2A60_006763 [Cordyceps javanica]
MPHRHGNENKDLEDTRSLRDRHTGRQSPRKVERSGTDTPEKPIRRVVISFQGRIISKTDNRCDEPRFHEAQEARVYEVLAPDTRTWAFKAILLVALDESARPQAENEVALLQRLRTT